MPETGNPTVKRVINRVPTYGDYPRVEHISHIIDIPVPQRVSHLSDTNLTVVHRLLGTIGDLTGS